MRFSDVRVRFSDVRVRFSAVRVRFIEVSSLLGAVSPSLAEVRAMLAAVSSLFSAVSLPCAVVGSLRGVVSSPRAVVSLPCAVVSSLRGLVSSLRGLVSSLRGVVSSLRGVVSSLRGAVSSLRGAVSSLRGAVSSLRAVVSSLLTVVRVHFVTSKFPHASRRVLLATARKEDVMVNLPYDFDTASTWQQVVKIVAAIAGVIALSIAGSAATGQWGAAAGFALCGAIFAFVIRIARRVPMGAAGTITASEVVARPVTQYGWPLRVPVGTFPIAQLRTVELQRTIVIIRPAGSRNSEDIGSVFVVGPDGSPRIEVVRTSMSAATIAARDLSTQLGLSLREAAAPGQRIVHVQLGA